jgi:hypothetical protein
MNSILANYFSKGLSELLIRCYIEWDSAKVLRNKYGQQQQIHKGNANSSCNNDNDDDYCILG